MEMLRVGDQVRSHIWFAKNRIPNYYNGEIGIIRAVGYDHYRVEFPELNWFLARMSSRTDNSFLIQFEDVEPVHQEAEIDYNKVKMAINMATESKPV